MFNCDLNARATFEQKCLARRLRLIGFPRSPQIPETEVTDELRSSHRHEISDRKTANQTIIQIKSTSTDQSCVKY